jgi:hypothetical protein
MSALQMIKLSDLEIQKKIFKFFSNFKHRQLNNGILLLI